MLALGPRLDITVTDDECLWCQRVAQLQDALGVREVSFTKGDRALALKEQKLW